MASEVEICNVALGHLGDTATVASLDPPEGSAQAEHCARFYPQARDALLSMHTWGFATRRIALAQLGAAPVGWNYAYATPTDALDILAVMAPGEADPGAVPQIPEHPFVRESTTNGAGVIYCNVQNATARYIVRVRDTARFSPLFVTALTWQLASLLAGPLIKGDAGMAEAKRCAQMMQAFVSQAKTQDANQRHLQLQHRPSWIAARGAALDMPIGWRP